MITPDTPVLEPSYEELSLPGRHENFILVAAHEPRDGLIRIHQDLRIYFGRLKEYETVPVDIKPGRGAWLQIVSGKV
jgi:hypothetical protein